MSVAKLAFAGATLVSSSALWQAFGEQTMPVETAVTRFAIVLVVSWVALSLVAELVFATPAGSLGTRPGTPTPQPQYDEAGPPDEDQPRPAPPTSMPNP